MNELFSIARMSGGAAACTPALMIAAALACLPAALAAEDLRGAYRRSRESSPMVARAQALVDAARARGDVKRAALLPHLAAAAGVKRGDAKVEGLGTPIDGAYNGNRYSVTLRQPIIDGQDWSEVRAARDGEAAARQALLAAEQVLIGDVFTA